MIELISAAVGFFLGIGTGDLIGLEGMVVSLFGLIPKNVPVQLVELAPIITGILYIVGGTVLVKRYFGGDSYAWLKSGLMGALVGSGLAVMGLTLGE